MLEDWRTGRVALLGVLSGKGTHLVAKWEAASVSSRIGQAAGAATQFL